VQRVYALNRMAGVLLLPVNCLHFAYIGLVPCRTDMAQLGADNGVLELLSLSDVHSCMPSAMQLSDEQHSRAHCS
jgi:hypothetical protein